jgi:hypothetical protein
MGEIRNAHKILFEKPGMKNGNIEIHLEAIVSGGKRVMWLKTEQIGELLRGLHGNEHSGSTNDEKLLE